MAVRFDADTDWVSLAVTIGGAGHVNFALGCWLYLEEFNDSAGVIAAGHLSNGRTLGLGCDTNFPTPRLCLGDSQTGFTSGAFGTQPALNGWVYAEFSSPNTTGGTVTARYSPLGSSTVYTVTRANGVEASVQAQVVHINRFAVGNANGFTGGLRAAYFRGYSGPTADDATFLAHKAATTGAGTLFFNPLADNTDTSDISGNGRTLTFNGTLTTVASPDLGGGADPIVLPNIDGPQYADLAVYDRTPFSLAWLVNVAAIASTLSNVQDLAGNAAVSAATAAALQLLKGLSVAASGQASATAAMNKAVGLAVNAAAAAAAGGQISLSVPLAGVASGVAAASGVISLSKPLAISAAGQAGAAGNLSTSSGVDLAAAASAAASASAALQLAVSLAATSLAQSTAAAAMTHGVPLAVAASGQAGVSGALSTSSGLSGAAVVVATSTGQLALSIALQGQALQRAAATATLNGGITLQGAAAAAAGVSGTLLLSVPLAGAAQQIANAGGGVVLTVLLGGAAAARSQASGAFAEQVLLAGSAGAQITVSGELARFALGATTDKAWRVSAPARQWKVKPPARSWTVKPALGRSQRNLQ